jgi:DNA repair photolyase
MLGNDADIPSRIGRATVTFLWVASILTPASGFVGACDFTLNPYGGCSFGCEYCYARFFARDDSLVETWGDWVQVKSNAVLALRRALASRGKRRLALGTQIYMSSVTDPYQPIEKRLGLTRSLLQELIAVQPRLTIQTRSPLVTRDIDLLRAFRHVRVNVTVPTDSETVRLRYEPRCPAIEVRLRAAEALAAAQVPVGISVSPMRPLSDPKAFGERIARLRAAEYVTQYLKQGNVRFTAGSPAGAVAKLREDGWTLERYRDARATIASILDAHGLRLLEGREGYAPAE